MINEEGEDLQTRFGNMTEPEIVSGGDNVLNLHFTEADADGNELEGGIKIPPACKNILPQLAESLTGKKKTILL